MLSVVLFLISPLSFRLGLMYISFESKTFV